MRAKTGLLWPVVVIEKVSISISITLFYVETWGVATQSPDPGAHVKNSRLKEKKNIEYIIYIYIIKH